MSLLRTLFAAKPTTKAEAKVEKKNDGSTAGKPSQPTTKKVVVRGLDQNKLPRNCLAPAPLREIAAYSFSDAKSVAVLSQVCRAFYHPVQSVLDKYKPYFELAQGAITQESTLKNKFALLAMLDANPWLLKSKIQRSKDESKRVFENKTLFQLVRGAGDDDFACAMKPAFIKLYKGNEVAAVAEMERQRQEMLESKEKEQKKEAECKKHLEEILKPVIAAIGAEQFNHGKDDKNRLILSPKTLAAIDRFREEYAKIQFKVIEGMHFRYNTLSEAFAEYARAAAGWGYNYNKCALFEDGVLSTIESDLPVNDAQKGAQGLYYQQRADKPESCNRSIALREGGRNFYEVVRGASAEFVLTGCYVDISFGGFGGDWSHAHGMVAYQFLCQTKTTNLQSLCTHLNPEPKSQFVAC